MLQACWPWEAENGIEIVCGLFLESCRVFVVFAVCWAVLSFVLWLRNMVCVSAFPIPSGLHFDVDAFS